MENVKSRYTEAQAKAAKKYLSESVEDIRFRVPKGQKAAIKAAAERAGESVNGYIKTAVEQRMQHESD